MSFLFASLRYVAPGKSWFGLEKVAEALKATEYADLQNVQIIFNMLRLKPATEFFPNSKEAESWSNSPCSIWQAVSLQVR